MGIWSNAFKMPVHPDLTTEEKDLLLKVADKVRAKGLGDVASLSVDASRPLHGLGAQAFVFMKPLLSAFFGNQKTEKFIILMENPKAVDFFIKSLNGEIDLCQNKNSK